ncbi:hypothetical protein N9M66_02445 [Litoreibacter sp.]|nr:hypothetical protein [Litoreibacter sp.]
MIQSRGLGLGLGLGLGVLAWPSSAALAACHSVVATQKVNQNFTSSQFTWNGQDRAGAKLVWRAKGINGQIHICGALRYTSLTNKGATKGHMHAAMIIYEGRTILKDITYFKTVKRTRDLDTAVAHCANTGVPVPQGRYTLNLQWADMRYGRASAIRSCRN